MRLGDCDVNEEAESILFILDAPHTLHRILSSSPRSTRYSDTVPPMTTMALNWHISPHFPQRVHFSMSTSGTGVVIVSIS
jgi:hypothetical protein